VEEADHGGRVRNISMRGHIDRVNEALRTSLVYQGDQNWFGVETLKLYVNDLGNTGVGGPLEHARLVTIVVHPVADAPELVVPLPVDGYLEVLEDTAGIIGADCCNWTKEGGGVVRISESSIQIDDPDVATVKAPSRWLLPNSTTLPFNRYSRWMANARQGTWSRYGLHTDGDSLNLDGLNPAADPANEVIVIPIPAGLIPGDKFSVTLQPRAEPREHNHVYNGSLGDGAVLRQLEIAAQAKNPVKRFWEEKGTLPDEVYHVLFEPKDTSRTHHNNENGWSKAYAPGQDTKARQALDAYLAFTGPVCCLLELTVPQGTPHHKTEISSLYHTPNISYPNHLARDNEPPPSIRVLTSTGVLGKSQGVGFVAVDGGPFDAEVRADDPVAARYRVEMTVAHGRISLTRAADKGGRLEFEREESILKELTFEDSDGTNDAHLVFHGPLSAVNRALEAAVYIPDPNWNSESAHLSARTESDLVDLEEVLIMVTDATGLSATSSVLLRVIASNDPPVINVPGTTFDERLSTVDGLSRQRVDVALISGIEDTVLAIPEIRVRDVDAAERAGSYDPFAAGLVEVVLAVSHGTLNLAPSAPVAMYINGDGDDDSTISFRASVSNANQALRTLTYLGHADYNGPDELVVSVDDLANSGFTPSRLCIAQLTMGSGGACFDKYEAVAMNTGAPPTS
jgi:hypothetical protein